MTIATDLAARRILMASVAYYGLDDPFMTDAAYDELSKQVSAEFHLLPKDRQFMLGSADAVLTSGNFFKITAACAYATAWHMGYKLAVTSRWKQNKLIGRWLPPTDFRETQ